MIDLSDILIDYNNISKYIIISLVLLLFLLLYYNNIYN